MSAAIAFYVPRDILIPTNANSGLGFYGSAGFAASVQVGAYQGRTFITDANGVTQGPEGNNITYIHPNSGIIGQVSSGTPLVNIPNYQGTLNIRFTNDTSVKTQNGQFRIYDRVNVNSDQSGVTCKVAQLIHPSMLQTVTGSGDTTWSTLHGSGVTLTLVACPGQSGERPAGVNTSSSQHDWYLAISASPDSVGSKTYFGGYVSLEYF